MGIVCVAVNPVRDEFATNSVDGRICIRSTQNGGKCMDLLLDIGSIIRTIPVGPMEAWKIAFSGDVREFVYPIDL